MIKELWCKLTGHVFYSATEGCDLVKCVKCGTWFHKDVAYGKWL